MIEQFVAAIPERPETRLVLRPNRALTARQLLVVFGVLAFSMVAVALYSFVQGNAFAPFFAVLDAVLVGAALAWAWRRSCRSEVIAVSDRVVEVRRSAEPGPAFAAHPYWVRVSVADDAGGARVMLGASGRQVEVGSFLAEDERRRLAARLLGLLVAAAGRDRQENEDTGVNP